MRNDVVHSYLQNTLPSSTVIIYVVTMSPVTETEGFLLSIYESLFPTFQLSWNFNFLYDILLK